jgi:hypothetical protein
MFIAKIFMGIIVFDDRAMVATGLSRWRIGYIVAILIFLVIFWNMVVLLWRMIDFFLRCMAARNAPGFGIGTMAHDDDYETRETRYVRNQGGNYELIARNDINAKVARDSDSGDVPSFFKND